MGHYAEYPSKNLVSPRRMLQYAIHENRALAEQGLSDWDNLTNLLNQGPAVYEDVAYDGHLNQDDTQWIKSWYSQYSGYLTFRSQMHYDFKKVITGPLAERGEGLDSEAEKHWHPGGRAYLVVTLYQQTQKEHTPGGEPIMHIEVDVDYDPDMKTLLVKAVNKMLGWLNAEYRNLTAYNDF